jgi:UDP-2,4-diacetamido-2,4,6-trideoxy-beta-L-altropyranose hydrolase
MRCLTLADALARQGVRSRFLYRHMAESLIDLIREKGHEVRQLPAGVPTPNGDDSYSAWLGVSQQTDALHTASALEGTKVGWLVVDHYALDERWEAQVRTCTERIVVIDDLANRRHDCDMLLDQNHYEDMRARYSGKLPDHAQTLLGPRYALLREEFRSTRENVAVRSGVVRRILVFFGGMDDADHTTTAVNALSQLSSGEFAVDVVIGAGHRNRRHLEGLCAANRFALHVQTSRMAELMATADLAVAAGGSASWERCCVGLPSLVIAVADNQRGLVRDAALAGLLYAPAMEQISADSLVRHLRTLQENPLLLHALSANGMNAVDGRGAERVVRAMGLSTVTMRRATGSDSKQLFEWRNHPRVRQVSRSDGIIAWNTHTTWLDTVLSDPQRILLIGEYAGKPVGVVRFDVSNDTAEVSIYKVPTDSAAGSGIDLLTSAERWLRQHCRQVEALTAEVLGTNAVSHRLFMAAGYEPSVMRYVKRIGL